MKKTKKKKDEFVYLVYCNQDPIVYGVYKSKQDAVRYAIKLIRYRKDHALDRGKTFDYYHFYPLVKHSQLNWMKDPKNPYYYDMHIFSACLNIPEDKNEDWGDDGCHVRVVRKVLS